MGGAERLFFCPPVRSVVIPPALGRCGASPPKHGCHHRAPPRVFVKTTTVVRLRRGGGEGGGGLLLRWRRVALPEGIPSSSESSPRTTVTVGSGPGWWFLSPQGTIVSPCSLLWSSSSSLARARGAARGGVLLFALNKRAAIRALRATPLSLSRSRALRRLVDRDSLHCC